MKKEIYLDHGATTFVLPEVVEKMTKVMTEDFGNPSSMHRKGVEAENYLKETAAIIAGTLKVNEKDIFFTSGGTESNNWALAGTALANKRAGNHIITTAVEHAAVLQPLAFLQEQGFRISFIPVDRYGRMDLEKLKAEVCEDTILLSMMYTNNEIGCMEPVEEAIRTVRKIKKDIVVHVDAIQGYGKFQIYPKRLGIDLLAVSGHKFHGPKGVGFLYINPKIKIRPMILGGGQQRGMRSGTDNVPGVAGMGVAAKAAYENQEEKLMLVESRKQYFLSMVKKLDQVIVNSLSWPEGSPYVASVSFPGVRSEVLLHALEDKGIYVSAGSACSSNKKLPVSSVLQEIGLSQAEAESTLRFSFSRFTTEEELEECVQVLGEVLPVLRRYQRH